MLAHPRRPGVAEHMEGDAVWQDNTGFRERHFEKIAQPPADMEGEQPAGAIQSARELSQVLDQNGRQVHQTVPIVLHFPQGRGRGL